jgi:ATPase subunit of ABC transporter with duplicated ATPase domains
MLLQQAPTPSRQDKIAHLQKFIDRFKAKASKAKQAQSRVKALDRMDRSPRCWPAPTSPSSSRSPQPAQPHAAMVDACFGYPPAETPRPARRPRSSCATSTAR